jgi:hypothetical protein
MNPPLELLALACGFSGMCWAARCTTVLDPLALDTYEGYVLAAQEAASARLAAREMAWVPDSSSAEAGARLDSGRVIRRKLSDAAVNQRIAGQNAAIIHWIGAVHIRRVDLADLRTVLEDYPSYDRVYRPIIVGWRAERSGSGPDTAYDATFWLQHTFHFASVFPQRYAFRVKSRIEYSRTDLPNGPALLVHMRSREVRESDSGVAGRSDLMELYHDHGIIWAVNAYWRVRRREGGVYLEFETITLARSVQEFACKVGFIPVPRSMAVAAMDALPAEALQVMLEGAKAECERRWPGRTASSPLPRQQMPHRHLEMKEIGGVLGFRVLEDLEIRKVRR